MRRVGDLDGVSVVVHCVAPRLVEDVVLAVVAHKCLLGEVNFVLLHYCDVAEKQRM